MKIDTTVTIPQLSQLVAASAGGDGTDGALGSCSAPGAAVSNQVAACFAQLFSQVLAAANPPAVPENAPAVVTPQPPVSADASDQTDPTTISNALLALLGAQGLAAQSTIPTKPDVTASGANGCSLPTTQSITNQPAGPPTPAASLPDSAKLVAPVASSGTSSEATGTLPTATITTTNIAAELPQKIAEPAVSAPVDTKETAPASPANPKLPTKESGTALSSTPKPDLPITAMQAPAETEPASKYLPEPLNSVVSDVRQVASELRSDIAKSRQSLDNTTQADRLETVKQTVADQLTQVSDWVQNEFAEAIHTEASKPVESNHLTESKSHSFDQSPRLSEATIPGNVELPKQAVTPVTLDSLSQRIEDIVTHHVEKLDSPEHSVVLRLDPPELGRVSVHVSLSDDAVSIRMVTSDDAARQVIEKQLSDLQQSLSDQGITVNQCQVDCQSSGYSSSDRGFTNHAMRDLESLSFGSHRRISSPTASTPTASRTQLDYVA